MPIVGISVSDIMSGNYAEAYFPDTFLYGHNTPYTGPVLDINKEYTMEELAAEYGHIRFSYEEDVENRTMENLYSRRIEMRNIIDSYNIPVKTVSVEFRLFEGVYSMPVKYLYSDDLMNYLNEYYINIYTVK